MLELVRSAEYGYTERQRLISALCEKYGFLKRKNIGRSCGGRDITAVKIGSSDLYSRRFSRQRANNLYSAFNVC